MSELNRKRGEGAHRLFAPITRTVAAPGPVMNDGWMKPVLLWKPVLFALLAGMSVCWVFATPLFGTSDETAQVMKAAGVVRGEFVGKPDGGPNTVVDVPRDLIGANRIPCFALDSRISAGCLAPLGHDNDLVPEETWVGYYPPLYYLLVGWPSLFLHAAKAIYAMRLVSALLGAALLAGAFFSAAEARGRALLVPATAALATPYLFCYIAAVNPSGMEMASALCAWTSGIALVDSPPERTRRPILIRLIVALAVLAQVRDLGPLFVAVIVLSMAAWYGFRSSWSLLARPRIRLIAIGIALCAAFGGFWVLVVGNLSFSPSLHTLAPNSGVITALLKSARRYGYNLRELVGNFGWTDTYPPPWVSGLGLGVMAMLLALGLRAARWRQRIIAGALLGFSVLFPILLIAHEASSFGLLGQGRYWFPLLAGVVVIAAGAGGSRFPASWLLWAGVALSEVIINVVCYQVALDRFRFGLGQPEMHAGWNPPGGADLWPIVYGVLSILFAWWWCRFRECEMPRLPAALSSAHSPWSPEGVARADPTPFQVGQSSQPRRPS